MADGNIMVTRPDDEPDELTAAELSTLSKRLDDAHREATQALADTEDDALPVDLDLSIGRLSRMDAMQAQQMSLARRQTLELTLKQVEAARTRIVDGRYGQCLRCAEPIGFRRLSVRPEAWLCRRCQSGRDDT